MLARQLNMSPLELDEVDGQRVHDWQIVLSEESRLQPKTPGA